MLALVKVSTIIIFIIIGLLTVLGVLGKLGNVGFDNLHLGDAPFHNGFLGFISVFLVAGYSFQGTELIGVTAGEAHNPKVAIPRAIKKVFWRIVVFFLLSIIILSLLIPYTSPYLVNPDSKISMSPFTIVFESAGFHYAASIINFVVLTAVISAANASLYTSSRVIWFMSTESQAPRLLEKLTKSGVPIISTLISAFICGLLIILSFFGTGDVFRCLINIVSLAGYIAWFGISLSHYRFRRAYIKQGYKLNDLPYKARFFPYAPLISMTFIVFIVVGQVIYSVIEHNFSLEYFFSTYSAVFLFMIIFLSYKVIYKTKKIKLLNCKLF